MRRIKVILAVVGAVAMIMVLAAPAMAQSFDFDGGNGGGTISGGVLTGDVGDVDFDSDGDFSIDNPSGTGSFFSGSGLGIDFEVPGIRCC